MKNESIVLTNRFNAPTAEQKINNLVVYATKGFLRMIIAVALLFPCSAAGQAQAQSSLYNWSQAAVARPYAESQTATQQPAYSVGTYSPTIYEVGTNELPSDAYNPANTGQERSNKPGIRTGHGDDNISGPEYGQSDFSPVGEPFVLLLCAAAFGAVIAMRRRRA